MRLLASTLMAGVIALGAVSPAFADPPRYYDRDWDRGRDRDRDRDWDRGRDRDWNDRDYRDGRRNDRWDDRRYYKEGYRDGWKHKHWRKGDRYDRVNYIVINDYDRYRDRYGYRLRPPSRGHYYVRDNNTGDILLIAAATGLILWALND